MPFFIKMVLSQLVLCVAWLGLAGGSFNQWSKWAPCSLSCGNGVRFRIRSRPANIQSVNNGKNCKLPYQVETQTCNTFACPVDGGFTEWTKWTSCSLSCGNGTRYRHRSCTNPLPAHGGTSCTGPRNDTQSCNTHKCAVNPSLYCGKWKKKDLRHPYTCCGNKLMDSVDHVCCNGTAVPHLYWKTAYCCGNNDWYDPWEQVCCQGKPSYVGGPFGKCCGKEGYNPRWETCCLGRVSMGKCCHGKAEYFPKSQICCPNGKVIKRGPAVKC